MVTLDYLHLSLGTLFLFMFIWHVISTAGAQIKIGQLVTENRLLKTVINEYQRKGQSDERPDLPVSS